VSGISPCQARRGEGLRLRQSKCREFGEIARRQLRRDRESSAKDMLASLALLLLFAIPVTSRASGPWQRVELIRKGNTIQVLIGGKPFSVYYFGLESPKPYLHPLRSAQGTVVTRGFPMRRDIPGESTDHPHHRALFFAHGDINAIDFWDEGAATGKTTTAVQGHTYSDAGLSKGRTVFAKRLAQRSGAESGTVSARFHLVDPAGKVIAEETQGYTFRGDEGTRLIDCEFVIKALDKPVRMGDTKEGTFAIRVVKALEAPVGHMLNSEGAVGEKEIWGKRARWVDYSGTVEGEKLGLAIFDHPKNPKYPTYWHARGYGLFAVNPFGEHDFCNDPTRDGSLTIPPGQTLTLRYRVFIHHGDAAEAQVAEAYERYVQERE
jgi:hypothetical protein